MSEKLVVILAITTKPYWFSCKIFGVWHQHIQFCVWFLSKTFLFLFGQLKIVSHFKFISKLSMNILIHRKLVDFQSGLFIVKKKPNNNVVKQEAIIIWRVEVKSFKGEQNEKWCRKRDYHFEKWFFFCFVIMGIIIFIYKE